MTAKRSDFKEHLKIRKMDDQNWQFEYTRVGSRAFNELDHGIDLWRVGDDAAAEKMYRSLIQRFPEFIDAHHHLAMLYEESGENVEALTIWSGIIEECTGIFPADFYFGRDRLP